jgi:hypothetical protein
MCFGNGFCGDPSRRRGHIGAALTGVEDAGRGASASTSCLAPARHPADVITTKIGERERERERESERERERKRERERERER